MVYALSVFDAEVVDGIVYIGWGVEGSLELSSTDLWC